MTETEQPVTGWVSIVFMQGDEAHEVLNALLRYDPKTVISDAAAERGTTAAGIDELTRELGQGLGPPWAKDHRQALAATVLAAAAGSG